MAETSSLLNCRTGYCTGGSNPPLSARGGGNKESQSEDKAFKFMNLKAFFFVLLCHPETEKCPNNHILTTNHTSPKCNKQIFKYKFLNLEKASERVKSLVMHFPYEIYYVKMARELHNIPAKMGKILELNDSIKDLSKIFTSLLNNKYYLFKMPPIE